MPMSGCTRQDMRSEMSFRILEELTGVDVLPLRTQSYEQERNFWQKYFETTRNAPQDQYTDAIMSERAPTRADNPASQESTSEAQPERVTAA